MAHEPGPKLPSILNVRCPSCDKKIQIGRFHYKQGRRHCSHKCAMLTRRIEKNRLVTCGTCHKRFIRKQSRVRLVNFCSPEHWRAWQKIHKS